MGTFCGGVWEYHEIFQSKIEIGYGFMGAQLTVSGGSLGPLCCARDQTRIGHKQGQCVTHDALSGPAPSSLGHDHTLVTLTSPTLDEACMFRGQASLGGA